MNYNKINIIGVPFNSDGTTPDLENPAQGLRDRGLVASLSERGFYVTDQGDLDILPGKGAIDIDSGILNFHSLINVTKAVSDKLINTWDNSSFQLILGGDCAILIGIFDAISKMKRNIGLVFFDGHADFQSQATSQTCEAADFELAIMTGRGRPGIIKLSDGYPLLDDNKIVAFGLSELDLIEESQINYYTINDLREKGIRKCIKEGLKIFENNNQLWLHFDVDVIDPGEIPVLIPTERGLTISETKEFLRNIIKEYNICGMSVSCYHPKLDKDNKAGKKIVGILKDIMTYQYSQE